MTNSALPLLTYGKPWRLLEKSQFGNKSVPVTYYLGGDYKFLLCILGMQAATCDHACIYCKVHKSDRWRLDKDWSLSDVSQGARTVEEMLQLSTKKKNNFSCARPPIFPQVPIDHVVVDLLHLFLRIGGNLFDLLITELRRQDGIEKRSSFSTLGKWPHMKRFENFMQEIDIPFHFHLDKDTKALKWRDLRGPELKTLFQRLNIPELMPHFRDAANLQDIWNSFSSIYQRLHNDCLTDPEISALQISVRGWLEKFTKLFPTKYVTPYMHILTFHVPQLLAMYSSISVFTQEGLERLNDKATVNYFAGTNRKGNSAYKQLLLKFKRIEYYEDSDYRRVRETRRCAQCGDIGHYRSTCKAMECE